MLKRPWPPGGGAPSPRPSQGFSSVSIGVLEVVFPSMPGALLRVKLKSLTA
jgi:hypothetical protein